MRLIAITRRRTSRRELREVPRSQSVYFSLSVLGGTFGEIAVLGAAIWSGGGTFGEIAVLGAVIWLGGGTFGEIAFSRAAIWLGGGTFGEIAFSRAAIWSGGGTLLSVFNSGMECRYCQERERNSRNSSIWCRYQYGKWIGEVKIKNIASFHAVIKQLMQLKT
jgi:hypothetical protein